MEQNTNSSLRDRYLGSSNITIPSSYQALCSNTSMSDYGCNLNLVTIPIEQSNYSIWIGPWEPCYGSCGTSARFRSVLCIDSLYLFPTDRSNCGEQIDYYAYDLTCNGQPCGSSYWLYSNYTNCQNATTDQVTCGGGTRLRNA